MYEKCLPPDKSASNMFCPEHKVLKSAMQYLRGGLSVIPIKTNGSKSPAIPWKEYQRRIATEEELVRWFGNGTIYGIGIVAGTVSGNLEVIDFDDNEAFRKFELRLRDCGKEGDFYDELPLVKTPNGLHLYYRLATKPEGNMKLAQRLVDKKVKTLVETRGQGGYVIAPGSPQKCHPNSQLYEIVDDIEITKAPQITQTQHEMMLSIARSLNEHVVFADKVIGLNVHDRTGIRPGDEFNARASWEEILKPHGWKELYSMHWQRPGDPVGIHATTDYAGNGLFYVFSTNAYPFDSNKGYSKFATYVLLNFGGDFQVAAKDLALQGYGPSTVSRMSTELEHISQDNWQEPDEIKHELFQVEPLPMEIVPEPFREWIRDSAHRLQAPPDGIAIAAIVTVGTIIGTGCAVRPKANDDWTVIPNLWGALVGRPGIICKTAQLKEGIASLRKLEAKAKVTYDSAKREYDADWAIFKGQQEALKASAKSQKTPKDLDAVREGLMALREPTKPAWRRYQTNDCSIEKLNELLAENPRGIQVFRDELIGFLSTLDKQGHESDRAFYLEGWNGDGSKTDDRIGRGTIYAPNVCISILGGIQPDKLQSYLYESTHGLQNDGLIQRFQMLVYPDEIVWQYTDEKPNKEAKNQALAIVERLAKTDYLQVGALQQEGDKFQYFHFNQDAQMLFAEWLTELQQKKQAESNPLIQEHLSKYAKLMPSLSLIFHLIELANGLLRRDALRARLEEERRQGKSPIELAPTIEQLGDVEENQTKGPISLRAAELAAAWCDYLEGHARRVYGLCSSASLRAAVSLAGKLRAGDLRDGFTVREVVRKQWRALTETELVKSACVELVELGWLKEQTIEVGFQQKSKVSYLINPKIKKHHEKVSPEFSVKNSRTTN